MAVAAPSRLDGVFVITHKRELWALHVEHEDAPQLRRCQVVAFQRRMDAEHVAHRLWIHQLRAKRWPDNKITARRPFSLMSDADVRVSSPNPLVIDCIQLEELKARLAKSRAAVLHVEVTCDDDTEFRLDSRYTEGVASMQDQIAWLELMAKRARRKSG